MQPEKLQKFIFEKLHNELSHFLFYHSEHHTQEVTKHALELGQAEHLSANELVLLQTAAILHDTGFLISAADHEHESCKIAREYLPQFDYTQNEIAEICTIIMATRLPQTPLNKLSQVLCDADLYYLGTNNYKLYSERLFREMKHHSPHLTNERWQQIQVDFLEKHEYFTDAAKAKLSTIKKVNFRKVKSNSKEHGESHGDFRFADIMMMIFGSLISAFGLAGFLLPNDFLDGGVTGISLFIHSTYNLDFPIVFTLVNIPFIILGTFIVNKKFALKMLISIVAVSLFTHFIPFPVITRDKVLISVFGGFFAGIGMGLNIRAGSAMDSIEVLAVYTLKRSGFTMSEIVMAINAIIFIVAASHFGIEVALYSMLTYFTASKTVDYVVEGIEAYTGVTIISAHSERIKEKLVNELGRGITIYKGERGYLPGKYEIHADVDIIFTVITRLELRRLKNLVYNEDPKAFIFANTIKETSGGILKRRASH